MMKTLRKVIIWIIVIIALLVIIAYLLPKQYKVETSIVINADKEIIFDYVCSLEKWEEWTTWNIEMDPTVKYELIGEDCTVGAIHKWEGEKMGTGQMVITEIEPYEFIKYDLSFQEGKYVSNGTIAIEPAEEEGFKVTWTDEGDLGYNPVARYMGLLMTSAVEDDFNKGLQNLKEVCESQPDYPDLEIVELEAKPAIAIRSTVETSRIGEVLGESFGKLMAYLEMKKANVAGYPFAVYHQFDPMGSTTLEAGIHVDRELKDKDDIRFMTTYEGKAVKSVYFGPYEESTTVYEAIEKYIKLNDLEEAGIAIEVYITDPSMEPDPNKWETHIYYPIK